MLNHIRRGGFVKVMGRGLVSTIKHKFNGLHNKMNQLKISGSGVAQMMNPDHTVGGKLKQSKRIKPLKFLV